MMLRKALAMRKKLLGDEHPDVAISLDYLADVLQEQGELAKAEVLRARRWPCKRNCWAMSIPTWQGRSMFWQTFFFVKAS